METSLNSIINTFKFHGFLLFVYQKYRYKQKKYSYDTKIRMCEWYLIISQWRLITVMAIKMCPCKIGKNL